jgi:hypothetical protein
VHFPRQARDKRKKTCKQTWRLFVRLFIVQYAVTPAYLASAAKEVQDNVRRMQPHPSIALWAGEKKRRLFCAICILES